MTAPGFVPPPRAGWWVKTNTVLFPSPAVLTLTGGVPGVVAPRVLTPAAATLTLTGGTPVLTQTAFVTRDSATGNLILNGRRFRYSGSNAANDIGTNSSANGNNYGGTVVAGSYITTHTQADALLNSAKAMNITVVKATWSVHTVDHPLAVQPTLGVFNADALDPVDYALQQCASLGIKLVLPFCEQYSAKPWYVAQTGGTAGNNDEFYTRTATIDAYKAHISFVLDHVNPYTGLALKNDPNVLCWQIGNEFLAPTITEGEYTTWADDIGHHIKVTEGARQLVQDGHYGPYGLAATYVDIYDQHSYDQFRTPAYLINEAQTTHAAGKAYFVGEFDWTDNPVNPSLAHPNWTIDQQLDAWERSEYIDGNTFWDLLAPLTVWNDGYTLHRPGSNANMQARGDLLADHALRMTGIAPKVFVNDTFTGVDGTALSSHVGEIGATWDLQESWVGVANLQNNRLNAGSTESHYYASGVPASADYTISADVYTVSVVSGEYAGVLGRAFTKMDYYYAAYVSTSGGTTGVYLDYGHPGADTNLGSQTIATPAAGSTHNLTFTMQGTSLSVYWDGVLTVGPVTNTTLPAAGRVGIIQGGSATTGFNLDNLNAIDAAAEPATRITRVPARIPNRNVGPMALRNSFRRAQRWLAGPDSFSPIADANVTAITVGLTANGVVGVVGSATTAITVALTADGINPDNVVQVMPAVTVPNRNVGPMALRQAFRRAQRWLHVDTLTIDGGDFTGTGPDTFDGGDFTGTGPDTFDGGSQ